MTVYSGKLSADSAEALFLKEAARLRDEGVITEAEMQARVQSIILRECLAQQIRKEER